jgi:hypothetical protein
MDATTALGEIRAYRSAARQIARDESLGDDRYGLLADLADRGRKETMAPGLVQGAIWAESWELLLFGRTPKPPVIQGDLVEQACRWLRRRGLDRCDRCRRPLPDERELDRWADLRAAAVIEAQLREGAVA